MAATGEIALASRCHRIFANGSPTWVATNWASKACAAYPFLCKVSLEPRFCVRQRIGFSSKFRALLVAKCILRLEHRGPAVAG